MFTVTYSCRVEITQNLPDNHAFKSLNELTDEFKYIMDKTCISPAVDIKISDASMKVSVPFD